MGGRGLKRRRRLFEYVEKRLQAFTITGTYVEANLDS